MLEGLNPFFLPHGGLEEVDSNGRWIPKFCSWKEGANLFLVAKPLFQENFFDSLRIPMGGSRVVPFTITDDTLVGFVPILELFHDGANVNAFPLGLVFDTLLRGIGLASELEFADHCGEVRLPHPMRSEAQDLPLVPTGNSGYLAGFLDLPVGRHHHISVSKDMLSELETFRVINVS